MCKRSILIVILLFISFYCYSQTALQFDGNYWNQLTDEGKQVFLLGFSQGVFIVQKLIYDSDEKAVFDYIYKKLEDYATIGDTIIALDKFYGDSKNLDVPVCFAYYILLELKRK